MAKLRSDKQELTRRQYTRQSQQQKRCPEAREPSEFTSTRSISEPKREMEVILAEFGLALKANGQPMKGLLQSGMVLKALCNIRQK